MDREQAREYVRSLLVEYLDEEGIDPSKPFFCLNPEHTDRNPSMSYDRKRNKVHCFSCGATYDTFDLIGIRYGITDPAQIFAQAYAHFQVPIDEPQRERYDPSDFAQEYAGGSDKQQNRQTENKKVESWIQNTKNEPQKPQQDLAAYFAECAARADETDYMQQRGISRETMQRFGIGYDPQFTQGTGGSVWSAVIIPTGNGSYMARNTDPAADKKNRIRKQGSTQLFNMTAAEQADRPIFIVEGEIDAISIAEVGAAAIGLGSTSNIKLFLNYVGDKKTRHPYLIALDNDEAGNNAGAELEKALQERNIKAYRVNLYGEHKDANEALCADKEAFAAAIEDAEQIEERMREQLRREYQQKWSAGGNLQNFLNGISDRANTPAIPTGFSNLDRVLDGGLYEGLYILGAISSAGKTTFVLQIADQIAAAGHDVLIFSLEMAQMELMARSISRTTMQRALQHGIDLSAVKTVRGITEGSRYAHYNDAELQLIMKSVEQYGTYAQRVYIREGIGDIGAAQIRAAVQEHIEMTDHVPVVIVDYLQILAPYNDRATDKQNTDRAVMELKRISRDYKTPVIGISSFNRQNYSKPVSMESFKESGAVEYSSDVLIGLQLKGSGSPVFNAAEARAKNPREIEAVILKNRNGVAGRKMEFSYYPAFNYYVEGFE